MTKLVVAVLVGLALLLPACGRAAQDSAPFIPDGRESLTEEEKADLVQEQIAQRMEVVVNTFDAVQDTQITIENDQVEILLTLEEAGILTEEGRGNIVELVQNAFNNEVSVTVSVSGESAEE